MQGSNVDGSIQQHLCMILNDVLAGIDRREYISPGVEVVAKYLPPLSLLRLIWMDIDQEFHKFWTLNTPEI